MLSWQGLHSGCTLCLDPLLSLLQGSSCLDIDRSVSITYSQKLSLIHLQVKSVVLRRGEGRRGKLVSGPAASTLPGNLLEMLIVQPHPRPPESETAG